MLITNYFNKLLADELECLFMKCIEIEKLSSTILDMLYTLRNEIYTSIKLSVLKYLHNVDKYYDVTLARMSNIIEYNLVVFFKVYDYTQITE